MTIANNNKIEILSNGPGSKEGAKAFLGKLDVADHPLTLVENITPYDFLVALREADEEQAAGLLSLASKEQFDTVLDLACWPSNQPKLRSIEAMIEPLVSSGLEGATKALDNLEDELLTLILRQYAIVHVREDKDDDVPALDGSELISCSDRTYFIELREPDDVSDVARGLIAALLNRPFAEYQPELECLRFDLSSELEENALRWRNARLADFGFGTREEGQAMLSPRDPEQVKKMAASGEVPHPLRCDVPVPAVYSENIGGNSLLDQSLDIMAAHDNPIFAKRVDALWAELGAMTSLFLTGTGCDLADLDQVAIRSKWARNTLALGLDAVCDGNPSEGARVLAHCVPSVIMQAGMGLLIPLKERAKSVLGDARLTVMEQKGALLDPPYLAVANALAGDFPLRWPLLDNGRDMSPSHAVPLPEELEAFDSLEKLNKAEKLLEEAEQLGDLLFERLGWNPSHTDIEELGEDGDEDLIVGTSLLLTALANSFLGEEIHPNPVSGEDAEAFCVAASEQEEEDLCGDSLSLLAGLAGVDKEGATDVSEESDPMRRLLLRLIHLGRLRIVDEDPRLLILTSSNS